MDQLVIEGGHPLRGEVDISRSKNAFLPIMAASLLAQGEVRLKNPPDIQDIATMKKLLAHLGANIQQEGEELLIRPHGATCWEAPYELVKTMRAGVTILGPLLARWGQARVSLPGGCSIGARPIDYHLEGLKKLGAQITLSEGHVVARAHRLVGERLTLPFPSVGATENLAMAATQARGQTLIENAAMEPEVEDLMKFLISLGAKIEGLGTSKILIEGGHTLRGGSYTPIADRIEAGTYLCAVLMARGQATLTGAFGEHLQAPIRLLQRAKAHIECSGDEVRVFPSQLQPFSLTTGPYPQFPTDLQAQFMALATTIPGPSTIRETVFERRFMHVPELRRLGAQLKSHGQWVEVSGGHPLSGAPVMCTDLRASASLVLAGLVAPGTTTIKRIYHLDRGHENIDKKLSRLGAVIRREKSQAP